MAGHCLCDPASPPYQQSQLNACNSEVATEQTCGCVPGDVCYQLAQKEVDHFSAQFVGVTMIQGKSCSLDSGREFSWPSSPCRVVLIEANLSTTHLESGALAVYAEQPWPLSKG